ncbi:MAG: hypothetical protein R2769_09595 [Saprospiraceae bacterium]
MVIEESSVVAAASAGSKFCDLPRIFCCYFIQNRAGSFFPGKEISKS